MSKDAGAQVAKVLNSGFIGQGKIVDKFELQLKYVLGAEGLTVNSATSGISLALHLIGVGPGDKVISTPMTCLATNEPILQRGAEIIWADVDAFGNIDPGSVEAKMSRDVKAIVAVDWGGTPCDYDRLREVSDDVPIIEDAAHAFRAMYNNYPISITGANYVVFSFQAIKHLSTGDGGFLVTPPEQLERARLLRWYGLDRTSSDAMRSRQDVAEVGYKFHMNDINAQIGMANISKAMWSVDRSRENAKLYDSVFIPMGIVPEPSEKSQSSYWIYTVHVPRPLDFEEYMKDKGVVASQVHFRNDKYTAFNKFAAPLPQLDKWFDTMCCIPVGWWLNYDEINHIINCVEDWIKMCSV